MQTHISRKDLYRGWYVQTYAVDPIHAEWLPFLLWSDFTTDSIKTSILLLILSTTLSDIVLSTPALE